MKNSRDLNFANTDSSNEKSALSVCMLPNRIIHLKFFALIHRIKERLCTHIHTRTSLSIHARETVTHRFVVSFLSCQKKARITAINLQVSESNREIHWRRLFISLSHLFSCRTVSLFFVWLSYSVGGTIERD
jgi:hypothetical protein